MDYQKHRWGCNAGITLASTPSIRGKSPTARRRIADDALRAAARQHGVTIRQMQDWIKANRAAQSFIDGDTLRDRLATTAAIDAAIADAKSARPPVKRNTTPQSRAEKRHAQAALATCGCGIHQSCTRCAV